MPDPCIPPQLPVVNLNWRALLPLVGQANAALARYDGILQALPNAEVLLAPMTANEAVLSSRIEGTQATLEEVLEEDAGIVQVEHRRLDIFEVMNYRSAVRFAEEELKHRRLSLSLVKSVHQRLMQGVRGHDKEPGRFRTVQNWIGPPGSTIDEARFVPPEPMALPLALDAWEQYFGRKDEDPIVQVAVAHGQFEILHPFLDGNGRIGRMLIPLLLFQRKVLSRPMFYLSEYLEAHRMEYYDALLGITEDAKWHAWLEFFCRAVVAQSEENQRKVRDIMTLYDSLRHRVLDATHSQFAVPALDAFFAQPIINSTRFAQVSGIQNRVTANGLLRQMVAAEVIRISRKGSGRTPAVYSLPALLNIVEGRTAF